MSGDLREGMSSSSGHPVVLLVLNVVLSTGFAYLVLWLTAFANLTTFSWERVAVLALILIAITFVVTAR